MKIKYKPRQLTVRLSEKHWASLSSLSDKLVTSKTDLITEALKEYLRRHYSDSA